MRFITLIIAAIFFTLSANVYAMEPAPEKCPSISAIQASHLWINKDGTHYTAFQDDQKYDTKDLWNFFIFDIDATSIGDADQKANNALPTLSLNQGPIPTLGWKCVYNIGFGYTAAAYSPPL